MTTNLFGASLGFLGFTLSLIIGLWVGNPFVTVVLRALLVLILFYPLGCLLAGLGQKTIQQNFDSHVDAFNAKENHLPEQTQKDIPDQMEEPSPV